MRLRALSVKKSTKKPTMFKVKTVIRGREVSIVENAKQVRPLTSRTLTPSVSFGPKKK